MPTKGQKLDPRVKDAERIDLASHLRGGYEQGQSIRALAGDRGHSYGLTRALLIEAGTQLRPRGGPRKSAIEPSTA
jgi:hypothetical protein